MKVAYVDTSWLLAIAFREPGFRRRFEALARYDVVASTNLLEAEFRAALRREELESGHALLEQISWVLPPRPLGAELERILVERYLRGADLWHVATALFLADDPAEIDFLTLDEAQAEVASALGFGTG